MTVVTVRVINTHQDYEEALSRLDQIFFAEPGTPEGDEAKLLTMMITDYESQTVQIPDADPIEVIKFVMEQQGLRQMDLAPYMGGKNRVSEVLSGKRNLTLEMMVALSRALHIPFESLISNRLQVD